MIRSAKVLFPCLGSSLHAKIKVRFSIESSLLSELDRLQQKSYIAQIMMKEISRTDRTFGEIKERSLTQHLIETVQTVQKQKNLDEGITNDMLKFFTTGITPNLEVFNQKSNQKEILDSKKEMNSPIPRKNQKPVIKFFPTTLISSQVFNNLLNSENKYQVLTGHSGISKSMSVQLYWYLSNIICEYKCKKNEHKNPKINLEQILENVPKLIYWDVIPQETPEQARTRILKQFFQIGDDLQDSNYLKTSVDPTKFYRNQGIKIKLLIDQFNLIVNLRKEIDSKTQEEIREIQKMSIYARTDEQKLKLKAYQKANKTILDLMQNCIVFLNVMLLNRYDGNVYLSSVQIQHHLLKEFPLNKGMHKMNPLLFDRLRFEELTSTRKGLYEFIDYFLFELTQKFGIPFLKSEFYNEKEVKKRLRNVFFAKIFASTKRIYLTPLLISEKMNKWIGKQNQNEKDNKKQTSLQKQQQNELIKERQIIRTLLNFKQNILKSKQQFQSLIQLLTKLFNSCLKYGQNELKQSVQEFLSKGSKNHKKYILSEMYIQNNNRVQNLSKPNEAETYLKEKNHYFSMDVSNMLNELDKKTLKLLDKNEKVALDVCIDKKLFHYDQKEKRIYSYYNYADIQEFLGKYHSEVILFLLNFGEQRLKQIQPNKKDGGIFEGCFVELVSSGKVNLFFSDFKLKFQNIYNRKLGFVPIPVPSKVPSDYHFLEKFKSSFDYLHKNEKYLSVFVPLLDDKRIDEILKNPKQFIKSTDIDVFSPSIDLIIAKIPTSDDDAVKLYVFELTVSATGRQFNKKFNKFIQRYQNFKDGDKILINGQQREVKMFYFVISAVEKAEGQKYLQDFNNTLGPGFSINPNNKSMIKVNKDELKKNKTKYSPLLSQINHVFMGKQSMQFTKAIQDQDLDINTLWFFDRLSKVIKSNLSQKKENGQQIEDQ